MEIAELIKERDLLRDQIPRLQKELRKTTEKDRILSTLKLSKRALARIEEELRKLGIKEGR